MLDGSIKWIGRQRKNARLRVKGDENTVISQRETELKSLDNSIAFSSERRSNFKKWVAIFYLLSANLFHTFSEVLI